MGIWNFQVTTDGDSRVQVTNKAKSDGDENLVRSLSFFQNPKLTSPVQLVPERASAAKTLNAKIRSGVPDLTKLIDVLRKSNLKESEIMEIVSQVGTDLFLLFQVNSSSLYASGRRK